jgi:hypothetical protein
MPLAQLSSKWSHQAGGRQLATGGQILMAADTSAASVDGGRPSDTAVGSIDDPPLTPVVATAFRRGRRIAPGSAIGAGPCDTLHESEGAPPTQRATTRNRGRFSGFGSRL